MTLKGGTTAVLNTNEDDKDDFQLEVSGSESIGAPLVAAGSEELDPDIIDMLYTKPCHKPSDGFGVSAWDLDN